MNSKLLAAGVPLGLLLVSASTFAVAGKVFVAGQGSDTVTVIDALSFKKLASITVGRSPHNLQVALDAMCLWVTNNGRPNTSEKHPSSTGPGHGQSTGRGELWALDIGPHAVVATVSVGSRPAHVVLTPDGRYAYVTNGGDGTVSMVDTQAGRLAATAKVGDLPHGIRMSLDGRYAFVTNIYEATASVIEIGPMKLVATVRTGKAPNGISVSP